MLRALVSTLVSAAFVLSAGLAAAAEDKVVNVFNWSDYVAEDTLARFEKETGIKVNYDVYDSNQMLEAKLLAGNRSEEHTSEPQSLMRISYAVFCLKTTNTRT